MRARLIPFPLELALLTVALGVAVATSEFEFADSDPLGPRASSFATIPTPPLPPAALVRSTSEAVSKALAGVAVQGNHELLVAVGA